VEAAFNPYRDWLGIEGGQRPGNHYELLGIDLFEGDRRVIAQAADVLTARIRSIRPGPHVAEWQRLIDAVAGARACLRPRTTPRCRPSRLIQPPDPLPRKGSLPQPPSRHRPQPRASRLGRRRGSLPSRGPCRSSRRRDPSRGHHRRIPSRGHHRRIPRQRLRSRRWVRQAVGLPPPAARDGPAGETSPGRKSPSISPPGRC